MTRSCDYTVYVDKDTKFRWYFKVDGDKVPWLNLNISNTRTGNDIHFSFICTGNYPVLKDFMKTLNKAWEEAVVEL